MSLRFGPDAVDLRDVSLRDGLQLTGKLLPTERKADLVRALLALGVPTLEVGSMARGDLVPPMANTPDLLGALTPGELARCWVWVATPRHVARAADLGATLFQYCLSVSTAHNEANLGRSTSAGLDSVAAAVELARAVGGEAQLCLATSFTCPFTGPVDPGEVLRIVTDERTAGTTDIVLCDTLGQAQPAQVRELFAEVAAAAPGRRLGYHGHDTWGMGVANTLAAIEAGATMVDGALGGLGGCPFAPGASGNTATEDLAFALTPSWLDPESFKDLVRLGAELLSDVDERNRSRAAQGARSKTSVFPWTVAAPAAGSDGQRPGVDISGVA